MSPFRLLVALAIILVLLSYLLISAEEPISISVGSNNGPATEMASRTDIHEELGVSHSKREPLTETSDADATPATDMFRLRNELQELVKLTASWPPNQMRREFSEVDMRALRDRVVDLGVTEDDLVGLLGTSTPADPLHTILLASFAFVPHMGDESKSIVVTAVQAAYPAYGMMNGSPPPNVQLAACYAGVFSLQMHDAERHLQAIALDTLQLYEGMRGGNSALRNVAALALLDIGAEAPAELLDTVKQALTAPPEGVLTTALYGALAQIGDTADSKWIVERAVAREPLSRGGIEAMRDPGMIGSLELLCTPMAALKVDKAYAGYLAGSAGRGLLSIGTPDALAAYKNLALSSDPNQWSATWNALDPSPSPAIAGSLARIALLAREAEHPMKEALGTALNSAKLRLMRYTVSQHDRRTCANGLRKALPELVRDKYILRAALEVLAVAGDKEDQQEFHRFLNGFQEEERKALQALWDEAHPVGQH